MAVSVPAGTRLGSYEIVAQIGAGGMGAVYRARDTRLKRDVAIKILPDRLAGDGEHLARFHREAQTLAALNHPHIAQVHGFEEHTTPDGCVHAFVMELVDGEDLARRLRRGAIPLDDACAMAQQVAEALEAAHALGIVHRDLKPANIQVRPDGTVKLLDFGIARGLSPQATSADAAPTVTAETAANGAVIGTPAYMAPEQAVGKPLDHRADIWAFGVVLFEMLCGRPPFHGAHTAEVIAAVLRAEPQWELLPAATPASIRVLLRRCLARDPRQRLQAIGDARLELADVLDGAPPAAIRVKRHLPLAATLAAAGAVAFVGFAVAATFGRRGEPEPTAPLTRTALLLPPGDVLAVQGTGADVALSPDERTIVYTAVRTGVRQLFRRSLDQLQPVPLNGTAGAHNPFFSPDGAWVGFAADGKLKKTRLDGSADPVDICDAVGLSGASWGPDETIVFGAGIAALRRVRASGGTPEPITSGRADDFGHNTPEFLPGGRHVLYQIDRGSTDVIAVVSLTDGKTTELFPGTGARYSNGHIVFTRGTELRAVAFDPATLRTTGDEIPLGDRPRTTIAGGSTNFALGALRTFVYLPAPLPPLQRVVWVDQGAAPDPVAIEPAIYHTLALSPSNERLAFVLGAADRRYGLWVRDLARRVSIPISTDAAEPAGTPIWSRDGRRLAFSRWQVNRLNLFLRDADATSPAERLTDRPGFRLPQFWTPDGTQIVFVDLLLDAGAVRGDLTVFSLQDRTERVLLQTPEAEVNASLSPDGRYMAYQSNESGRWVVFVRPFPAVASARWTVSTGEGGEPVWGPDGRAILYRSGGRILRVAVDTARGFTAGAPELVAETPTVGAPAGVDYLYRSRTYDVARNGTRVIALQDDPATAHDRAPREIVVVTNWLAQLRGGRR